MGSKGQAPGRDDGATTMPRRGRGEGIEDADIVTPEEGRVSRTGLERRRSPRQGSQQQHGPGRVLLSQPAQQRWAQASSFDLPTEFQRLTVSSRAFSSQVANTRTLYQSFQNTSLKTSHTCIFQTWNLTLTSSNYKLIKLSCI